MRKSIDNILLEIMLKTVDVPEQRKDTSKLENVRWLLRNMHINNKEHKFYEDAMKLLKKASKSYVVEPAGEA